MDKNSFLGAMDRLDELDVLANDIACRIKDYGVQLSVDDVCKFFGVNVRVARLALVYSGYGF